MCGEPDVWACEIKGYDQPCPWEERQAPYVTTCQLVYICTAKRWAEECKEYSGEGDKEISRLCQALSVNVTHKRLAFMFCLNAPQPLDSRQP